jgi:hypothetical protein
MFLARAAKAATVLAPASLIREPAAAGRCAKRKPRGWPLDKSN